MHMFCRKSASHLALLSLEVVLRQKSLVQNVDPSSVAIKPHRDFPSLGDPPSI